MLLYKQASVSDAECFFFFFFFFWLIIGALGKAPSKVTDALPEPEPAGATAASEEEEEEEDIEEMQSRLAALRS